MIRRYRWRAFRQRQRYLLLDAATPRLRLMLATLS